jgi:hypothetical protein
MRSVGLDVHLDFCEVAIIDDGEVRFVGRVDTTPGRLELFVGSLGADDRVALGSRATRGRSHGSSNRTSHRFWS